MDVNRRKWDCSRVGVNSSLFLEQDWTCFHPMADFLFSCLSTDHTARGSGHLGGFHVTVKELYYFIKHKVLEDLTTSCEICQQVADPNVLLRTVELLLYWKLWGCNNSIYLISFQLSSSSMSVGLKIWKIISLFIFVK